MKKVVRDSMKDMCVKMLKDFRSETEQDDGQVEAYANNFVSSFERYLRAYNEFKED